MKTYAVELKRTSFVTVYVEAESKDHADELAWEEIHNDGSWGTGEDATWETNDIYEQEATR